MYKTNEKIDMDAIQVLNKFLDMPIDTSLPVLQEFAQYENAFAVYDGGKKNFVYVPGKRKDRVLLVAHADTVWDSYYLGMESNDKVAKQEVYLLDGVFYGRNKEYGIGADDRSGCAILELLKESGHSLLVLDGEEHGQIAAHHLKDNYTELYKELNQHTYMIQLDRRNGTEYKFYNIPVREEFKNFIVEKTGYSDAGIKARTDIVVLCGEICGVNLSVGYYNEHIPNESLCYEEWYHTFEIVKNMIDDEQKRYLLNFR